MEKAIRDLQGVVYAGNGAPSTYEVGDNVPAAARDELSVRLSALEEALADLTGQVETLTFRLRQQEEQIAKLASGPTPGYGAGTSLPGESAVQNLPSDATGGPADLMGGETPQTIPVDLPDDPDAAFEFAYEAVLAADYDRARRSLEAYIEKFPQSPRTPEAKFLLGEVYLATGANNAAARTFLDHVSTYKDDPRSPEAYLKLGISFARLDRPTEACRVFQVGQRKFTDIPASLRRRYEDEIRKNGCQ